MSDWQLKYYNAAVCVEGHVLDYQLDKNRTLSDKFCGVCGKKILYACEGCGAPLRGTGYTARYGSGGVERYDVGGENDVPRPYCYECGNALPWTASRIDALQKVAQDKLTGPDLEVFLMAIPEIATNSALAERAADSISPIMNRFGVLGEFVQKTLVELASSTVAKIILGQP